MNAKTVKVMVCQECDEAAEVGVTLYECGDCGARFNRANSADGMSHKCPDCNKFSAKVSDNGCPECGEGELEEVERWLCGACEEVYETEAEAEACCSPVGKTDKN